MRIIYSPTFADYWSLNVYVLRKQFRLIIPFIALSLILFLLYPLLPGLAHKERDFVEIYRGGLGLLILPGIAAFVFAATYWGAKKRWTSAEELREEREYSFDDAGVCVKSKSMEGFTDWKILTEAVVTKRFVFITTAQQQFYYFPISAVPDLPQLRELLAAKMARVKIA